MTNRVFLFRPFGLCLSGVCPPDGDRRGCRRAHRAQALRSASGYGGASARRPLPDERRRTRPITSDVRSSAGPSIAVWPGSERRPTHHSNDYTLANRMLIAGPHTGPEHRPARPCSFWKATGGDDADLAVSATLQDLRARRDLIPNLCLTLHPRSGGGAITKNTREAIRRSVFRFTDLLRRGRHVLRPGPPRTSWSAPCSSLCRDVARLGRDPIKGDATSLHHRQLRAVTAAPDRDQPAFLVMDVDIDHADRASGAADPGGGEQAGAGCRAQVVGAEVDGRHTAAQDHHKRESRRQHRSARRSGRRDTGRCRARAPVPGASACGPDRVFIGPDLFAGHAAKAMKGDPSMIAWICSRLSFPLMAPARSCRRNHGRSVSARLWRSRSSGSTQSITGVISSSVTMRIISA